jgi:hypothetical protein
MTTTAHAQNPRDIVSTVSTRSSTSATPIQALIHALEQQALELDEAHFEALREARDASRRATEIRLRALEIQMQLCALVEHEPIDARKRIGTRLRPAILRLAQLYFDEPGKYRLALYPLPGEAGKIRDEGDPAWCSKVVFDATRPEGRNTITISDAVRATYRAAEERGYILMWADDQQMLEVTHCSSDPSVPTPLPQE